MWKINVWNLLNDQILHTLNLLDVRCTRIEQNQEKMMATLDEVLADVTAETTKIDSISALLAGLQQQLKDALAGITLPPATQAKVDAIFAAAETNRGKIDDAIAANTPPPPPPPNPVPVPTP